jgi:hypothetical protein
MSFFHRHLWVDIERFYVPPTPTRETGRMSEMLFERLIFGFTTIRQRCAKCDETKELIVLGKGDSQ